MHSLSQDFSRNDTAPQSEKIAIGEGENSEIGPTNRYQKEEDLKTSSVAVKTQKTSSLNLREEKISTLSTNDRISLQKYRRGAKARTPTTQQIKGQ